MALSIIYAPKEVAASPAIDIVAVHGLGGDATSTWTHPKSKKFWLKDFLPQQIPDARIMAFGYDAHHAFGRSAADTVVHANSLLANLAETRADSEKNQRPLIFIAHSLGGIIVKQALLLARVGSQYHAIKDAKIGIFFLGTPHRGSENATYGKVLANVAQFMSHRPSRALLSALLTNSDILLRLTSDFCFQVPDYEVYSLFETRRKKGLSSLIVEKHSALLGTNNEEQIAVDADHSTMCKFETEGDDTFATVYKIIERIRNNSLRITNKQSVLYNQHFEVTHLLSPVFVGRDADLRRLTQAFTEGSQPHDGSQQRFVLFGLGGSGKTQICLKYTQIHRERYWGVFWIDASSKDRIEQCFTQIASLLQVEENVDSVKRTLANTSQAWLLVFDDADDPQLELASYFPAGNRGDIIISSRNPQCQIYSTIGSQRVGLLSLDESTSLLYTVAYGTTDLSQDNKEACQKIVKALGCLPLAIVQAAAYIRETSCSLDECLEVYKRHKRAILQYRGKHLGTDYLYSVYATWQISVDAIASIQSPISDQTLRLLKLLGFYHSDRIPLQMFYNTWYQSTRGQSRDDLPWHDATSDFFDYQQSVRASVTLLASFSLITRDSDASVSLHPLAHQWCRDRISDQNEQQVSYRRALLLLTSSVNWEFETKDYTFRRLLLPHVHHLLGFHEFTDNLSEDDKIREWPTLDLVLGENGRTGDAIQVTEEVVKLCKSRLGEDHPDTLASIQNLAVRYSEAGRRTEALELSEDVLRLRMRTLGEDHPDTLASIHNLAIRYSETGRPIEALQLSEEVLMLRQRKLGEDHPNTLASMSSLAIRYSQAGRRREALQLSEEVLRLRLKSLGEDHPDTLASMHSLAIRYSQAGRRREALQLSEEVLRLRQRKLGEEHPNTLASMYSLAIRYSETGRLIEALQLSEEVLRLRKKNLGEDHPDTLASMHSLAIRYSEIGRQAEAQLLREEMLKLRRTGDLQDGFDERSFVDSGHGTASDGHSRKLLPLSSAEINSTPQDIDDASSEYSDISTEESKIDGYMQCLAEDLFTAASSIQPDPQYTLVLCQLLPDLLQEFALRIGLETLSKEGYEVMVFVHKYRRRVAGFYERRVMKENEGQEDSTIIPVYEKVTNWLTQKSADGTKGQEETADASLLESRIHDFPDEQDDWTPSDASGSVDTYREFITKTSAYSWLLARMRRGITQASEEDDLLKTVHDKIWKYMGTLPRISTRRPPVAESLIFMVEWNPLSFIVKQEYSEDPSVALLSAITLTGSPTNAQALSCLEYLNQTWPLSGKQVASLLHKLIHASNGDEVQDHFSDGSMLIAWSDSSSIYVKVIGSRSSITEVGEQLAWLGAALHSSPFDGIAYCRTYIDEDPRFVKEQVDFNHGLEKAETKTLRINFSLEGEHPETDQYIEGKCWCRLFRNPVLVRGFPIMRRTLHESGLELPLNMIAQLMGVSRAHVFNDVIFIKGYSTMLVPSRQEDDLIVWHVFAKADGSRISYLENSLPPIQGFSIHQLQTARHIVGWCSGVRIHAGGRTANYDIDRSRLPAVGGDCVLEKVSISGGKFITAGFNFSIGTKDVPVHVSRKPYMQKLRWVSSKFIVFWDEEEKRGWLVNGVRALLHLVRASLKHYQSDAFKEALLSKSEDILEPAVESQEDYAINILRSEHNMKLPIYAEKDEVQRDTDDSMAQGFSDLRRRKRYYRLEDRVEELYEVLEKLIDHQINVAGQAGVKIRAHLRRRLEGWDFKDLASDKDPIYPRVATLHALGKGWVDFIRSIQAVTLFGKRFGQIIEPSSSFPCSYWSDVPRGKFYLAACMSDLRQIMEMDGDCTANPMRLCDGISWYTPAVAFDSCRCTRASGENHSDFVQILWPTRLQSALPKQEKVALREGGAVIFGHNITFKWKWGDTGDPIEGDPGLESSITEDDFHDSGLGLTETSGSRQGNRGAPGNDGNETISLSPQTSGDDGGAVEISHSEPVSPQNVPGSNAVDNWHDGENALGRLEPSTRAAKMMRRLFKRRFGK